MSLRNLLTRRNIVITAILLATGLGALAYLTLRRPPRVAMERFIPASALAYLEINSLADLLDGLTETTAWEELAPALGISSQIEQIGQAADLMSRTGFGPDEAVIAGRAQFAVALTGLEAETGAAQEGPYLHLKPRLALIVETHSDPLIVARVAEERVSILAGRIYGDQTAREQEYYSGVKMTIFKGPQPERQLVAASTGSLLLLANNGAAIKACIDVASGRTESLSGNAILREMRPALGENPSLFAFVTEAGIETFARFGPAIIASRLTTDPERVATLSGLVGHLARQTARGLLYSSEFSSGGVKERYLTLLRPQVAESLALPFKNNGAANLGSFQLIPAGVEEVTLVNVDKAAELPKRVLEHLKSSLDVVGAMALRSFVLSFYEQLGVDPSEPISGAVGDEITLARFGETEPAVMLVQVRDQGQIIKAITRYLGEGGASVSTESYNSVEIAVSTNEDRRAAAFVGDYAALGTRDQLMKIVDTYSAKSGVANDPKLKRVFLDGRLTASLISYRPEMTDAGEMMLAVSKIARVTDGSRQLLETPRVKEALDRLAPAVSFTEFRDYGIYTESQSAVGSFNLIGSLAGGQADE